MAKETVTRWCPFCKRTHTVEIIEPDWKPTNNNIDIFHYKYHEKIAYFCRRNLKCFITNSTWNTWEIDRETVLNLLQELDDAERSLLVAQNTIKEKDATIEHRKSLLDYNIKSLNVAQIEINRQETIIDQQKKKIAEYENKDKNKNAVGMSKPEDELYTYDYNIGLELSNTKNKLRETLKEFDDLKKAISLISKYISSGNTITI